MDITTPDLLAIFEQGLTREQFREATKDFGFSIVFAGGIATREYRTDMSRLFAYEKDGRIVGGEFR